MRHNLLGFIFFALPLVGQIPDEVKDNAKSYVDEGLVPGLAIGLTNGENAWFFSAGESTAGGSKINEHSIFEIGDATRVFTSTLLAIGVEEGKVGLEDPIKRHLAKQVSHLDEWDVEVTLRHLATHSSSLPKLPDNLPGSDSKNPWAGYSSELLYQYLSGFRPPKNAGLLYHYSHLGMGLLGQIMGLVYEKDFSDLLQEKICGPLNMKETGIGFKGNGNAILALGHDLDGGKVPNWDFGVLAPASGLRSSAHDLILWLKANLEGGPLRDAMDLTQEAHFTPFPGSNKGLGWQLTFSHDSVLVWHHGETGGYHCFMGFNQNTGMGAVVLANAPVDLNNLGIHLLVPKVPMKKAPKFQPIPKDTLNQAAGFYSNSSGQVYEIERRDDRLFMDLADGLGKQGLYAGPDQQFHFRTNRKKLTFLKGADGVVSGLEFKSKSVEQAVKLSKGSWPPKPVVLGKEALASYEGTYLRDNSQGRGLLTAKLEEDGLSVAFKKIRKSSSQDAPLEPLVGDPLKLTALGGDVFFLENRNVQLTFKRDEKGKVTGLNVKINDWTLDAVKKED